MLKLLDRYQWLVLSLLMIRVLAALLQVRLWP